MSEESIMQSNDTLATDEWNLSRVFQTLKGHRWLILLFSTTMACLAALYVYSVTPTYRTASTLLIEPQKANLVSLQDLASIETDNTNYYQTQFLLLESRALVRKVFDKLQIWDHPDFADDASTGFLSALQTDAIKNVGGSTHDTVSSSADNFKDDDSEYVQANFNENAPAEPLLTTRNPTADKTVDNSDSNETTKINKSKKRRQEIAINLFLDRLSVDPLENSKLVKIHFSSSDPTLATNVANTLAEQYITGYLDTKMQMTTKASLWLGGRLAALKESLDASEEKLLKFKSDNGLISVNGNVGQLTEQELLTESSELARERFELNSAASLYNEVRALRNQPELLATVSLVHDDPMVRKIVADQGEAENKLKQLSNRYGPKHPKVINASSRVELLQNNLIAYIDRVVGAIQKQYNLQARKVRAIESKVDSSKKEVQIINSKRVEMESLEREVKTNKEIYNTFFSRMTETRSRDGLESANAVISDYAITPYIPIKPRKELTILLVGFASLLSSIFLVLLSEQLDRTIKSANDVEEKLKMRFLGVLPLLKKGFFNFGNKHVLPTLNLDKNDAFKEAINSVRTTFSMEDRRGKHQVILVTSSVPREGKTTVSINLAHSLGQFERVLLIDSDMRRPQVAKLLGLTIDKPGLSNLIANTEAPRNCITESVHVAISVDVLSSGPLPDQPLELLSSKRMGRMVAELRNHYDRIIIDSAPIQSVSDSLLLSELSDSVVYVVKSHDTAIELVQRGIQRLRQFNAPLMGVLVNQADFTKFPYYGGDYYYGGYAPDKSKISAKNHRTYGTKIRLSQEEMLSLENEEVNFNWSNSQWREELKL